jgi:hypothetical protein
MGGTTGSIRLTPAELEQVDQALDEDSTVIPELAALISDVRGRRPQS